jgi:hypothetical protein
LSVDDDRRFVNNAFSRALHPPKPDDEKATSPGMYIVFGLLSLVLVALFVAALVLPPLFTHTLIVRGIRTGRVGMLVFGLVLAAVYFAIIVAVGRKLMRRPPPPPADDGE